MRLGSFNGANLNFALRNKGNYDLGERDAHFAKKEPILDIKPRKEKYIFLYTNTFSPDQTYFLNNEWNLDPNIIRNNLTIIYENIYI